MATRRRVARRAGPGRRRRRTSSCPTASHDARRIRALIVDDEPLAREGMRLLLGAMADVDVVGEAGDGTAAVRAIGTLRPDVVLLDVQMPGLSGFDVVARGARRSTCRSSCS